MIAMALASSPRLLLADEPTTALDVTLRGQILQLLDDLQRQAGMAVLMITHDLHLVRRFADRVAVMERGQLVEQGGVSAVMAAPRHAYTRKLLASVPRRDLIEVEAGAQATAGEPLAPGEQRFELTPRGGRWTLVTDAWYFREGDGQRWEQARYGEFRVEPDGRALLVGMADAQLRPIVP